MLFLSSSTRSQLFITTHSSVIIDTPGAHVFGVHGAERGAVVRPLLTNQDRFEACRNLGYKASDLLQSNCVIWVEGPSDRIYLVDWLQRRAPGLIEGVHFSIMFYGGRLISHLSASDSGSNELVELLPINRRCAILIDSDKGSSTQAIRSSEERLVAEAQFVGSLAWVTEGREIENYYSAADRDEAIRTVHQHVARTNLTANRYGKPLSFWRTGDPKERTANKIQVAEWLVSSKEPTWDSLKLDENLTKLVAFIHASNHG